MIIDLNIQPKTEDKLEERKRLIIRLRDYIQVPKNIRGDGFWDEVRSNTSIIVYYYANNYFMENTKEMMLLKLKYWG